MKFLVCEGWSEFQQLFKLCVSDEYFHACQPSTPRLLCPEVKGIMIFVHYCWHLVLLCNALVNGSGFLSAQQ